MARAIWLGFAASCTCASTPPAPPPAPAHFGEWERLVERVVARDPDGARVVARDLTEGDVPGSEALGGALGFLQVADADDLPDGLAAAAVACGACHRDIGLGPPAPGAWSHDHAAHLLVGHAVHGAPQAPPAGDPLAPSWATGADAEGSLAAALRACGPCHPDGP